MKRDIRAQLDVDILEPSTLEFQVAVSPLTGAEVSEELSLELNGRRVEAQEVAGEHGNRIHRLPAERGNLKVSYTATILGQADEVPVEAADLSTYLRPSRYAEADKFFGFAAAEFGEHTDPAVLLEKVSSWVGARLTYSPGSSDPIDGAVDTPALGGRSLPRLRAPGGGAASRRQSAGPTCRGLCAGLRSHGLSRCGRGRRRQPLASGGRNLPGTAPNNGPHHHRT